MNLGDVTVGEWDHVRIGTGLGTLCHGSRVGYTVPCERCDMSHLLLLCISVYGI